MAYQFDFLSVLDYTDVLLKGIAVTAQLTLTGGVLGVAVAVAGAWAKTQGPAWLRTVVSAYVELMRNTPFLIQLFFIFFGLPSLGVHLPEMLAASLAMVINLGAYGTEIVRAGLAAPCDPHGRLAQALGGDKFAKLRLFGRVGRIERGGDVEIDPLQRIDTRLPFAKRLGNICDGKDEL